MQMGGWTLGWDTIGGGNEIEAAPAVTTICEGLEQALPESTELRAEPTAHTFRYRENGDAYAFENEQLVRDAARHADAVVVALGEGPHAEWYGDRDELALPEAQRRIVRALDEETLSETPVVGVMIAGRPRGQPELIGRLDALLMAYQPGTAGGSAVANVLLGETNPSGRLPFVWPKSVGMVPIHHNAHPEPREAPNTRDAVFDRDPLYEFGHGMSYTEFTYSDISVDPCTVVPGEEDAVTATVTAANTGEQYGEHAVQIFAEDVYGSVQHAKRRLVGYGRVHLEPGDAERIAITVPLERLEVVPGDIPAAREKVVEAGEYTLRVGDQTATLTVESSEPVTGFGPVSVRGCDGDDK